MTEASHHVGLGCPARPHPWTLKPHNCAPPIPEAHILKVDREMREHAALGDTDRCRSPFLFYICFRGPSEEVGLRKLVDEKHPVVAGTPKTQLGGWLTRSHTAKASLKDLWTPNPGYLGREREAS